MLFIILIKDDQLFIGKISKFRQLIYFYIVFDIFLILELLPYRFNSIIFNFNKLENKL